jgi:hypothetical protein
MDGLKELRKALKDKKTDQFEIGTVLRWEAAGRYTYAALKTPVGWFTTARDFNHYIDQVLDFDGLVKILLRPEVTDIVVATEWEDIR